MKFLKSIVLGACMLFASVSFANNIDKDDLTDFDSLTPTQKAQIVTQIANAKEQNGGTIPTTPEKLQEWAEVGTAVGSGLVAVATELGVEVNEFAKTGVGKLAIVLLVWKVMGNEILHLVGGFIWFITFLPAWAYYFRKLCIVKEIKYNEQGKKIGIVRWGADPENNKEQTMVNESKALMLVVLIVIVAIGLITTFSG